MKPGRYTGYIRNYGLGENKSGMPNVWINFDVKDTNGDTYGYTWFGSLKEGRAREITIDALLACGLTGNNLENLKSGIEGGALDQTQGVELHLEEETWDGKTRLKVKWINKQGGMKFDKLASENAAKKMKGLNLDAEVAARRKETGITDDLPF